MLKPHTHEDAAQRTEMEKRAKAMKKKKTKDHVGMSHRLLKAQYQIGTHTVSRLSVCALRGFNNAIVPGLEGPIPPEQEKLNRAMPQHKKTKCRIRARCPTRQSCRSLLCFLLRCKAAM